MRPGDVVARWTRIARLVGRRFAEEALPGRAAEMSFYFFLSLFPVLLLLIAVLGVFFDAQWLIRDTVVSRLDRVAPAQVVHLIDRLLRELSGRPRGPLSIGVVVALWAASSGMVATIRALNRAYGVKDERSWWRRRLLGIALTVAFMLLTAAAMVLLAYGVPIAEATAQHMGLGGAFVLAWRIGQWPVVVGVLLVAFHMLYRYAPHHARRRERWLQPGTLIGIALWLAASFGLRIYAANVARYDVAYGSLGAVVVVLLWFYLTNLAVLAGAEINAQAERVSRG
jgi:membrane protein